MEHKSILGGEQWLPFARSRINALRATGVAYAAQKYEIDGVSIRVRIEPGQEYISIERSSESGYQFFTTGPNTAKQDFSGVDLYRGYAVAISTRLAKDDGGADILKLSYRATGSTLEAPVGPDSKQWTYSSEAKDMAEMLPRKNTWQIEGITEPVYYPGLKPYPSLQNVWAPADPLFSLAFKGGRRINSISPTDVSYDSAPERFTDKSPSPKGKSYGLAPDADWYRQACSRVVESTEFGSREFIVLMDVSNTLQAYAVTEPDYDLAAAATAAWPGQAIKTTVAEKFVKRQSGVLPAWVRPAAGEARTYWPIDTASQKTLLYRDIPQHKWSFNSTGTKCCAVVFEDLEAIGVNDVDGTKPPREENGTSHPIQESLPGLVELELAITITGPNPEDFTFSASIAREMRPTIDLRYIMSCAYSWGVEGKAEKDDLMLLLGTISHDSSVRYDATQMMLIDNLKAVATVRNETTGADIRRFVTLGSNYPYSIDKGFYGPGYWPVGVEFYNLLGLITALDLRVLAYVVQNKYTNKAIGPNGTARDGMWSAVARIQVYMRDELVEEKLLVPNSPLNTRLATEFADTTDRLEVMAVNEVGYYPGSIGIERINYAHRSLTDNGDGIGRGLYQPYYGFDTGIMSFSADFQAGAYWYSFYMACAMAMHTQGNFCCRPDGSWSLVTSPTVMYSGEVPSIYSSSMLFFPSLMVQDYIDIIEFKAKLPDGSFITKRTTHLEAFNAAYGKSLTKANFLCTFSETYIGGGRYMLCQIGGSDAFTAFKIGFPPSPPPGDYSSTNPVTWDFRWTPQAQALLTDPVLGGSQLFY